MSTSVEDNSEDAIYENTTLQHREIRLLSISRKDTGDSDVVGCELKIVHLDNDPPACYTALSYTWGLDQDRVISVNGNEFPATRNLNSALEHFRDTQDPVPDLWVDAVCINQKHNNERVIGVRDMQSIFATAEETWAWLGHEEDESSKAIDLINDLAHVYRSSCQGGNMDLENANRARWGSLKSRGLENHVTALSHLLSRDYWYRVWIVQEIAVSKKVIFFCGGRKFFWDSLLFAVYILNFYVETRITHSQNHGVNPFRGVLVGIERILSIQSVRHDYQMNMESDRRDPLLSLLSNHRSTGASNAKDKFIALAGLARDSDVNHSTYELQGTQFKIKMTPDGLYDKEVEEGDVYTFACQFLTEEKGHKPLDFLDSAGLPRNYAMPSWVPDWSVITQKRPSPLLYWQLPTKKHNAIVIINAPGKARPPNGTTFSIREEVLLQARMRKVSSTDTVVTLPSIHEPPEKPLLLAKGRIVGSIDSVITSHSTLEPLHKDGAHQTPHDRPAYPNGDLSDVLWKTLVLDRDLADGVKAPENWGDIFYHCISHPPSPSQPSVLQRWWTKCKHFKLCGSTLEEIALARKPSLPPLYSAEELARLQSAFILGVGYRKLATTESGYLCLVPLDAEAGDIVAILIDCSAPVLLRRQENKADGYEFIGTCYVHGIMHGEAVDQLQDEDAFPEEFDIR